MAEFFCAPCNIQLNSTSQWNQHVTGGKHMRAVTISQPLAIDMTAAIPLPNGTFKCKSCDDFVCSGPLPFEQHLAGQKHLKNVQRGKDSTNSHSDSPASSHLQSMSPVRSPPTINSYSSPTAATNNVSSPFSVLQSDGSYKCKVCVDFTCTGPIPMQDHLKGKSHLKNLNKSPVRQLPFEPPNTIVPPEADRNLSSLSVDERIEKAWNHQTICGYVYNESFSSLSLEKKIEVLSPHFAFIGKDDPLPNFVKYLSM